MDTNHSVDSRTVIYEKLNNESKSQIASLDVRSYNIGLNDGKGYYENIFRDQIDQVLLMFELSIHTSKKILQHQYYGELWINPELDEPKAILAIPQKQMLNNEFIENAYNLIRETKNYYSQSSNYYFDFSLISYEKLSSQLLEADGFAKGQIFNHYEAAEITNLK
jgi:hypothetical protein